MGGENQDDDVKMILHIGINRQNNVVVSGPITEKKMCLDLLAHAILIINGLKPKKSPILMPPGISGMPQ